MFCFKSYPHRASPFTYFSCCSDVDECVSSSFNNCSLNEKCVNEHGSFRCECIVIGQCKGQWILLEVANQITCNKALCNMHRSVYCALLGSLRNHDDGENDNVKKKKILWAKQQLCTCITLFSTFLWRLLHAHDYDVKPANVTFYGGRKHTTTNFPFSFWNWIKSLGIQLQEKLPVFDKLSGCK